MEHVTDPTEDAVVAEAQQNTVTVYTIDRVDSQSVSLITCYCMHFLLQW